VVVRLLGPPAVEVAGEPIRTGLRHKARELLAALLIHPAGLTPDAAVELLWPDADPTRGTQRLYTVVGNLRATLRDTTGLADHAIIDRTDGRYHADPNLFDCDLWRFQTALADATTAPNDRERTAALRRAVDAYTGDLVAGTFYEWAEAAREDLRRRAVDAAARLAELHETAGDYDAALAELDTAMRHDPYAEDLYRRTMRIQAALGRHDAVRRTYQLLETRLADLDVDPTDATTTLRNHLLEQLAIAEARDRLHI
jgi:DNA-binding SARP family transcriptional activator